MRTNQNKRGTPMINKIITPEVNTYQIKKGLTIKIWNDKTFSILLEDDTVDLTPNEVINDLYRIVSAYKATYMEENL